MSTSVFAKKDVYSKEELEYILSLPEVAAARQKIDAQTSGSVYFSVALTSEMKKMIADAFGLDLAGVEQIPLRWIKGDSAPHIDRGVSDFEKTHLMYLTDSAGSLVLGEESYPITGGSAFVFPEGIHHKTVGTGAEPRLLLGPMSEAGVAVGVPPGLYGPGGTTFYIRQVEGTIDYSTDQSNWYTLYLSDNNHYNVQNTNTDYGFISVIFTTDISLNDSNQYFIVNSEKIKFGTPYLREDGTKPIITIDGVPDYHGLIQNSDEYHYIDIYNLHIHASGNSTLSSNQGWLCQQYFGQNSRYFNIINCSSDGPIPEDGGGIIGSDCVNSRYFNIIGCSSSGTIGYGGGGIVGANAGGNNRKIESCWSTGEILERAGGILGENACSDGGNITILSCYSEGPISGASAGGIAGFSTYGSVYINQCYSRGEISGQNSGGIIGESVQNDSVLVTNCYSSGSINSENNAGGIAGNNYYGGLISNCYVCGAMNNNGVGFIIGGSNSMANTCYSEVQSGGVGGWNTAHADTVLQGAPVPTFGSVWIATGINQPYELFDMGYSPYTKNIIEAATLVQRESGLPTGYSTNKDMTNNLYTTQFNPNDYQNLFPNMADFIDSNIIVGDKNEIDRLKASYWGDLGDDIFDNWGFFYIYNPNNGQYYFPLLNPQNLDDGVLTTQTFAAFGRTFTIIHGWTVQGVFKIDVTVADNLPFRFGAYGTMGSNNNTNYEFLNTSYTIGGSSRTLYYHHNWDIRNLPFEELFSYFIPKNNNENTTQPFNAYYDSNDKMSMVTNELTTGVTLYFSKSFDVYNTVINDLQIAAGETGIATPAGGQTAPALIPGRSYTLLAIQDGVESSYGTITIDSTTGAISTTAATVPGTYTLYIRNSGSYNITTYSLIVIPGMTNAELTCCDRHLVLNRSYNEINGTLVAGNTLLGGVRRGVMSYSDYIRMQMAKASKR